MKRIVIAVTLALSCGIAHAEPYAIAGIGVGENNALGGSDSATPVWAGAGFRSGQFAAEATYANLGDVEEIVSTGTRTISSRRWTGKGLGLFALGHYGSFLVKAGVYRLHSNVTGSESLSENIWAPTIAIGWQTQLSKSLTARASLEYVRGHGEFGNSRMIGTSLLYGF